jgi:putative IMPACT (imprinted ancient) family translation regulator
METVDTTKTVGTSQQVASPEERRLQQEEQKLMEQEAKVVDQARQLGIQKAQEEEAAAQEKARLTAEKQAKTEEITKRGEDELNKRMAEADAQYEQLRSKADIKDYWADKSTGDKVLAGLAVALGGLGAGMSGDKQNRALDIIQKNVEQDFERQKANFMQQKGVLDEARRGGEAGRQALADQLRLLDLSKAAAYESLADRYSALATRRGVPAAQLEADKVQLGLRQKAIDSKQQFEQGLRKSVTSNVVTQINQEVAKPASLVNEDVKKAQDEFQANEDFKGWKEKRKALDSYKALREGGADGAAVADFIATGLKQGSFGPEMVNILEKKNLVDKAGNVLRENIVGGYNPKLLESLGNGLVASEAKARQRAKPVIERSKQVAKSAGLPADYFAGTEAEAAAATAPAAAQPQMSERDKQALEWANANPNDARSAEIKRRLGK